MTDADHTAAALLWAAWQDGRTLPALPDHCRPRTRADGYRIQARLPAVAGRTLRGWKIAATSAAGQAHIGVDGPLAGRILDGQVDDSGATVSLDGRRMRVAEPEFAFRFGRRVAPRSQPYTVDEVLAAVDALLPAFELPDSRYDDFVHAGAPQLLADDACAWRFVFGAPTSADWRAIDLCAHAVHGTVRRGKQTVVDRHGAGSAVLGDPRVALAWLVNELSSLDLALEPGQVVSTGTCMTPLELQPGDEAHADFGVLGALRVRCAA
ncbi:MAG: hydratase [Rubrivivax sp.]